MWRVEITPKWYSKIGYKNDLKNMDAKLHKTKYRKYWTIDTEERKPIERSLKKLRVSQEWVQKEWTRSNNYRDVFFKYNKGPYRCRYCNRGLKKEYLQVDHLVSIQKVKNTNYARMLLKMQGIHNVNDKRNLVAACGRCNQAKGGKLGMWYIRGLLGKYPAYWICLYSIYSFLILAGLFFISYYIVPFFLK